MIAANGVAARFLDAQRLPVAPPRGALARALGSHRRARGERSGDSCLPAPDVVALPRFLQRDGKAADPAAFPDLSLAIIRLIGAGEYVVDTPGSRAARAISGWP